MFTRDGALWATTLGNGIYRVAEPMKPANQWLVEHFDIQQGLSANYTWPLLQDLEDHIWIGGNGGLDRFHRNRFAPAPLLPGGDLPAMVADPQTGIWVATPRDPIRHIDAGKLVQQLPPAQIAVAAADRDGVIWFGGHDGLWQVQNGQLTLRAAPPQAGDAARALAFDAQNSPWIWWAESGPARLENDRWRFDPAPQFPDDRPLTGFSDSHGRV